MSFADFVRKIEKNDLGSGVGKALCPLIELMHGRRPV
jgi:hypothetical protein